MGYPPHATPEEPNWNAPSAPERLTPHPPPQELNRLTHFFYGNLPQPIKPQHTHPTSIYPLYMPNTQNPPLHIPTPKSTLPLCPTKPCGVLNYTLPDELIKLFSKLVVQCVGFYGRVLPSTVATDRPDRTHHRDFNHPPPGA